MLSNTTVNVLLVEDEPDIRFLLRFWLSDDPRCGDVFEADSPTTALSATDGRAVDVILCDFMLIGGTAADCVPMLRADHPQAQIIVYTSSRVAAEQAKLLDLGADRIVEKVSVVVEDVVELALGHAIV
jgi:DNA-binding NarL/FixJ family response regulator